jgi:hypothetical protein
MRGPASALGARMVRVISAMSSFARCLPRRVRLCTQRGSLRIAFSLRVLGGCIRPSRRSSSSSVCSDGGERGNTEAYAVEEGMQMVVVVLLCV